MGTGTGDMIRRCREVDLPEPEFAVTDGFQTIIRRLQGDETGVITEGKTRVKTRVKTGMKTREKILILIAEDPSISSSELAAQIGISVKGIQWHLNKLKQDGRIERIGPARGDSWKILEDNSNIEAHRIWLNLELAKKPVWCLEYIIVHEMVHLLERHHNDNFRKLMDHFMPQWRLFQDELNQAPLSHETWSY